MMHTELINKTRDHSRVWRCSTVRVVSGLTVKYIQEVFITTNVPKHDSTTRDCRATNQRTAGNDTVPCVLADPDAAEKFNILIYDGLFIWRLNNT